LKCIKIFVKIYSYVRDPKGPRIYAQNLKVNIEAMEFALKCHGEYPCWLITPVRIKCGQEFFAFLKEFELFQR